MLELLLCSMLTILPDYLYRRLVQGKRLGKEITFFSVWFELRWGIVSCLMLTISLITLIFYFHPSTSSATLFFRTVPILPEASGRVAEVRLGFSGTVAKGDVIFKLDSSKQEAAAETARRKIAEIDAALIAAQADVVKAEGQVQEAKSALQQAQDEVNVKTRAATAQSGYRPAEGHRKAAGSRRRATRLAGCRQRRQAVHGVAGFDPPTGREGERAGRTGAGPGRS